MDVHILLVTIFVALYVPAFAFDMWRNRQPHLVGLHEAAAESAFWVGLALVFNAVVWYLSGVERSMEFLSAFLVEKALSVDNLFVFLLIFNVYAVPHGARKRVLLWGVIGAIFMRGIAIYFGVEYIHRFVFLEYVFGGILLWSSFGILKKILTHEDTENHNEKLERFLTRILPYQDQYHSNKLIARFDGKRMLTKLAFVLVFIEISDVIFAIDSIPAVVALSKDPLIILTSNVSAILGLRALYFLLAGSISKVYYLKHALVGILGFIGFKMLLPLSGNILPVEAPEIGTGMSLSIILLFLVIATLASLQRSMLHADAAAREGEWL